MIQAQPTTSEVGPIQTVEIARLCVWTAQTLGIHSDHDALEADILGLLGRGVRNPAAYGEQTATVLHELDAPHWKRFFFMVRTVIRGVASSLSGPLDEGMVHLRAWGSRLSRAGDYSERHLRLSALHNHSPAFLSAVYYLRLPKEGSEGDGGTFFVNPFPHSLSSPHPGVVVSPEEGSIVVFPSWVMHGPVLLDYTRVQAPRIVIGIDAHLIPR